MSLPPGTARAQTETTMIAHRNLVSRRLALAATIAVMLAMPAVAIADTTPITRDGQHDFDWMFGTWKTSLRKLEKPLSGSTKWIEFEGTQVSRPLLGGLANVDEFVVENADRHVKGLTLRLYNPETREWSIYWANAKAGVLAMPPTVGHWTDGRGEFFDREEFEGKPIVVRYVWSGITETSAHFEQSFSSDDGKTWEVNWISDIERTGH
jgi:hypothetical protein